MDARTDPPDGERHYLFLIHGTWGRDQRGWYRVTAGETGFATRLAARLAGTPLEGALWRDIEVFEWSGANTHEARMAAARDLATLLVDIRCLRPFERSRFHFVAHSHGGNVVLAALLRYLLDLPEKLLNAFGFPIRVWDETATQQFFAAASRMHYYMNSRSAGALRESDQPLRGALAKWKKGVEAVYARFQSSTLTPRDHWTLNKLVLEAAFILLRDGTFASSHGVSSVVFLGTPFYYKRWQSGGAARVLDRASTAVAEAALAGAAAWIGLTAVAAAVSWLPAVQWIGFNPARWPLVAQAALGLATLAGAVVGARRLPAAADTNVYFDETWFHQRAGTGPLTELQGRRLFDALVVTSGYLDEAYAGLSSFPLVETVARRSVDRMFTPRPWVFIPAPRPIGTVGVSPGQFLRRWARRLGRRVRAVVLLLLYPVRVMAYRFVTRPIALNQTARLAQSLAFGLPPDELLASDLIVRDRLDVPQIDATHLDVSKDLAGPTRRTVAEEARFSFLWDDEALAARFRSSAVASQFPDPPSANEQRHLLAIEERLREFFGVAGFRHAHYYESDRVIDEVARYLLRGVTPG